MKNMHSLLTATAIAMAAAPVHATVAVIPLAEPSMYALGAAGAVAGLLVWRSRRKR